MTKEPTQRPPDTACDTASDARASERRGPGRPSQQAENRERIIRAAERLYADRDPSSVTFDELSAESGVPRTTIYRIFRSQRELMLAIIETGSRRLVNVQNEARNQDGEALDTLDAALAQRAYFRALIRMALEGLLPTGYPPAVVDTIDTMRELDSRAPTNVDPRVVAVFLAAATVGWQPLEEYWMASMGFSADERQYVRSEILRIMLGVMVMGDRERAEQFMAERAAAERARDESDDAATSDAE